MRLLIVVAMMAVLVAAQSPESIYVYHSELQEVKTGGVYNLDPNVTCNDESVWVCRFGQGVRDTEFCVDNKAVFLTDSGHWAVGGIENNGQPTCSEHALYMRSDKLFNNSGEVTSVTSASQWHRYDNESAGWVYDENSRVTDLGCRTVTACLQLKCQEPDDGYSCDECSVDGATMNCGNTNKLRQLLALLVHIVIISLIAGTIVYAQTHTVSTPYDSYTPTPKTLNHRYRAFVLRIMRRLGLLIGTHKGLFFVTTFISVLLLVGVGLPFAKRDVAGSYSADWVPRGGRLEEEINYVKKWSEESKIGQNIQIMIGPEDLSENVLSKKYLYQLLEVYQEMYKVQVPAYYSNGSEIMVGFQDWCLSIDNPLVNVFPCMAPSSLDCFFEGSWMLGDVSSGKPEHPDNQTILYSALEQYVAMVPDQLSSYTHRPSIKDLNETEIKQKLGMFPTDCQHWAPSVSRGRGYVFGSVETSDELTVEEFPKYNMVNAKRLVGIGLVHSARRALSFRANLQGLEESAVADAMDKWFDAVSDKMEELSNDRVRFPDTSISIYMTVSLKRMFKEIGKTGYVKIMQGLAIVVLFVMLSQFTPDTQTSQCLCSMIGLCLVLLSICAGFGLMALYGIKFNHTILQALPFFSLGIGVDDMFLLLKYYHDVPNKSRPIPQVISDVLGNSGMSITFTSLCNALTALVCGVVVPIPALSDFLKSTAIIVLINYVTMVMLFLPVLAWSTGREKSESSIFTPLFGLISGVTSAIAAFLDNAFEGFKGLMEKKAVQGVLFFINVLLFVVLVTVLNTSNKLEFGFDVVDLTPKGSFLSKGFQEREDHIVSQSLSHQYIVKNMDFPNNQRKMKELHNWVKYNKWTNDTTDRRGYWVDWLDDFALSRGWLRNSSGDLIPTDTPREPTLPYEVRYDNYINPDDWYQVLMNWRNPAVAQLDMVTSITTDPFGWRWGFESFEVNNTMLKSNSAYTVNMALLQKPSDWVDHIDFMRVEMDRIMGVGNAFPEPSGRYLQMQEFISLEYYFWISFAVGMGVVFCVSLAMSVSVLGSVIVTYTALSATIEVMAILMLVNFKFQSIVAVTILLAIGVNVEFSAHVIVGFETAEGTTAERIRTTISHTFAPVLEGGISSYLMFSLLSMSQFPYVVKYFFWVLFITISIGLLHGLLLLPATIAFLSCPSSQVSEFTAQGAQEGKESPPEVTIDKPEESCASSTNPLNAPRYTDVVPM
eukprot:TRINITY_DN7501_c0_g1_i1.p1 TRINITY_DN7501_c0_g1~~TRINITY_DN7501_c0_g1_i1.p1  ORF type:complete len:1237 (+),score=261.05 TRINITY_DN7501_c0_g1_i1:50-3712(+)